MASFYPIFQKWTLDDGRPSSAGWWRRFQQSFFHVLRCVYIHSVPFHHIQKIKCFCLVEQQPHCHSNEILFDEAPYHGVEQKVSLFGRK